MGKIDGGLRPLFRTRLGFFDWQSVESHSTGNGTPDVNYCKDGVEGWIEYKKTNANRVKSMRTEQVAWCERRLRHGGRVFYAVRQIMKPLLKHPAIDNLWLIRGPGARTLFEKGLLAVPKTDLAGRWLGGPRNWDWAAVSAILTGR